MISQEKNTKHEKSKYYKMIRLAPKDKKRAKSEYVDTELAERIIYNNLPTGYKFKFQNGPKKSNAKQTNQK